MYVILFADFVRYMEHSNC